MSTWQAKCEAIKANKAAMRVAWKHGHLWMLLDSNQYKAYLRIRAALRSPFARFVLNWARRTGKTYLLLLIVMEECIRHKKHRYNVAAATKDSLREFVWPAVDLILETCPQDLRPKIQEWKGRVTFNSGSYIVLAGCNDKRSVERLRGPWSNGNIIEEMGAMPEQPGLTYVLKGILNPQLLTTSGWTLMATTPPRSSGHAAADIVQFASGTDNYSHCTLNDNPRMTPELKAQYLEADAALCGMTPQEYLGSVDYRREWLAIIETDPTYAVLPAFTEEKAKSIVQPSESTPVFVDFYDSMDIGFSPDWTALLYAYWSFERHRLRITGERLMRRMGSPELAAAIQSDEKAYFGGKQPFLRVSDNNNPILLNDLACIYGLNFVETRKDNLRAAVADVNRWIANGTIEIDPSCKMLIAQCKAAAWHKKGKEFERSENFGHYDLVASLVYLVRNVIPNINRVPYGYGRQPDKFYKDDYKLSKQDDALVNMFDSGVA